MGKKSSDPADVRGAAEVEGQFSRETARDVTYADRPDQYNPYGSVTWGQQQVVDPATGELVTKWTQNESLNQDAQQIFDNQMGMMQGRSGLASGMMGRVGQEMSGAPDWQQFGDVQGLDYDPSQLRNRAESDAYQRSTNRLDPQWEGRSQQLEIDLRNKGLRPGDQAYDSAIASHNRGQTDAYEQASLAATQQGMGEAQQLWQQQMGGTEMANQLRQQQIQEYIAKRGYSLGEMEQLGEGQTVADLSGASGSTG